MGTGMSGAGGFGGSASSSMAGTTGSAGSAGSNIGHGASPSLGTPDKHVFKDPAAANTLISQAAKIPVGAAQPTQQTSTNPLVSMFSNMFGIGGASGGQTSGSSNLPIGAAGAHQGQGHGQGHGQGQGQGGAQQQQQQVDCSMLMPLIMSKVMAAGEGMNSPEALEAISEMRKQYLPYSCQELKVKYTGMPFRMCCPGKGESARLKVGRGYGEQETERQRQRDVSLEVLIYRRIERPHMHS